MNESIKDYVENNYTPEMREVLNKCFSLLDRLNVNSYEAYFINEISTIEEKDTGFLPLTFVTYLEGLLFVLTKEFGFGLADELTLEQKVDFIRAYVDLEDYIDHETVIRILETDNLDTEKLAEVVCLTFNNANYLENFDKDSLLPFIFYADEAALYTLLQLHTSELSSEDKDLEAEVEIASDDQVRQVKAYKLFMDTFNLEVDNFSLVRLGYAIGLPFKVYYDVVKDNLLASDQAVYCREMIALLLLSKEYWSNPMIQFEKLSDENFNHLNTVSETNSMARGLIAGLQKFKAENRIK